MLPTLYLPHLLPFELVEDFYQFREKLSIGNKETSSDKISKFYLPTIVLRKFAGQWLSLPYKYLLSVPARNGQEG